MHYIRISMSLSISMLLASAVGAMSKPSPSSSEFKCNDSVTTTSQVLTECLASGHAEGSAQLRHCVCVGLGFDGDRCTTNYSGSSPSVREAPSVYSTGVVTGDRNFDGDPKIQAMVTVPPPNHKHTLHNAAATEMKGKAGGVGIPRLSGSKKHKTTRQRQRRRKTTSASAKTQTSSNGISTVRKVVGGIALGILVMVV